MEHFKTVCKNIAVSNNKHTITPSYYDNLSSPMSYGAVVIHSTTTVWHKWKFCIEGERSSNICIGIEQLPTHPDCNISFWSQKRPQNKMVYCRIIGGDKMSNDKSVERRSKYGKRWNIGAIVEMILDLSNGTLSYSVNNKSEGVCYKIKQSPDISYVMAVNMHCAEDKVTLLDYSYNDNANNNEMKQNEDIIVLKEEIKKQQNNKDKEILRLKNEMKQFQEAQNNKISTLKEQNNRLIDENTLLKDKVNKLENDQKELVLENNTLKIQIKQLKKQNIDISKWKTWNTEEVLLWVLSLENDRYLKYENKLKSALIEESVTGEDLNDVDSNDIKRWGVVTFKDNKILIKKIKELINNNNYKSNMNEGINAKTAYI
eukprot:390326_1